MMQEGPPEIEMQTYSVSYAYPSTYPTQLPYCWDGEGHLTQNCAPYQCEPEAVEDISDQFSVDEEKEGESKQFDFSDDKISPMNFGDSQRSESIASISSLSTDGVGSLNSKDGECMEITIDQQLDFILESVKKQKKAAGVKVKKEDKKKKTSRKRKTVAQLEVLQNEIGDSDILDKVKMKQLAEKTGLKVGQVYKWYWDYKRKSVCPSQC